MLLEKLDEKEIDSIPKSTKSVEYAYLNEKGIINNDGVYYWKKPQKIPDDKISLYTNMEIVQLLSKITLEIDNVKENQTSIANKMVGLVILLSLILTIILIALLH